MGMVGKTVKIIIQKPQKLEPKYIYFLPNSIVIYSVLRLQTS